MSKARDYPATDCFENPHRDLLAAFRSQAIHPGLTNPRFNLTDPESGILERQQHPGDTAMPVGRGHQDVAVSNVDREHFCSPDVNFELAPAMTACVD